MATVTNKTGKPLSVPLPRGKTLHLGPWKSGQISSHDIEAPTLEKLVEAGTIEIVGEESPSAAGDGRGTHGRAPMTSHAAGRGGRRSGDR